MSLSIGLAFVSIAMCLAAVAGAADPSSSTRLAPPQADTVLQTLRHEHPRLLVAPQRFAELRKQITADDELGAWFEKLQGRADRMLAEPASTYEIPDGVRLLATSRRVLSRVETLALLHKLTADRKYLQRAWKELEAAAAFPGWNPKHFLDTAEMSCAFGIAYDWLYDAWTKEQRAVLKAALVKHGLTPALEC